MARTRFIVTPVWTLVNAGVKCIVTMDVINKRGNIEFNDVPNDPETALRILPNPNFQLEQLEDKPVYVRSNIEGYEIVVDTES